MPPRSVARLFSLSFLTGFSGAMMPGPLLAAVIQQTLAQGFIAVVGLITGHALLELAIVGCLMFGLQSIVARPRVRAAIGLVGGAALLYMGADILRSASGLSLDLESTGAQAAWSLPQLLLFGAAICAANPYFTGWWATVGAGQLAHAAPRSKTEYLAFYLGHEASDYAWYSLVGILLVTGRHWLTTGAYRLLLLACGGVILLLGLWFLAAGARLLLTASNAAAPNTD